MVSRLRQIVLTDDVIACQRGEGAFEMHHPGKGDVGAGEEPASMPPSVRAWLQHADSFFIGTVSSNGWPHVQHRGGRPGFVRVLDDHQFAFDDVAGNGQLLTVGNLRGNDRVMIFLIDYQQSARLKIWGRATVSVIDPNEKVYANRVRTITVRAEAWNFNCSAFIPKLFKFDEV